MSRNDLLELERRLTDDSLSDLSLMRSDTFDEVARAKYEIRASVSDDVVNWWGNDARY